MCCEQIERQLGRYIDGELPASDRVQVEAHLESCANCRAELADLREIVSGIARPRPITVPPSLWSSIERRLEQADPAIAPRVTLAPPATRVSSSRRHRFRLAPWLLAASIMLAVGLGLFGVSSLEPTAHASTIDFGVLLDALPLDAQKAFRKFLMRYDAKPTTPIGAKQAAPNLNFELPDVLPGGFKLRSVYDIRIGNRMGVAASYDRNGEFLALVFHPPMNHERFGSHQQYPCVIGKQCGHKVEVGQWKLVHLTDPTTCHCLLSRLNEKSEMPAILKAVAPSLTNSGDAPQHEHPHP